jgi:isochorismate hydrolase
VPSVKKPFRIRKSRQALLILDMLSDFDFPEGRAVVKAARRIAKRIAALKSRATRAHVPVIYVNDNLGQWRSDIQSILARCMAKTARGRDVVCQLAPSNENLVLLKPRHSGFYATPLTSLLEECGASELVLTGISAHQCVLFTANDAYLREFDLIIPRDAIAASRNADTALALRYFDTVLGARIPLASRVRFGQEARHLVPR